MVISFAYLNNWSGAEIPAIATRHGAHNVRVFGSVARVFATASKICIQ
jgi:predicted nucleotidyltransferase